MIKQYTFRVYDDCYMRWLEYLALVIIITVLMGCESKPSISLNGAVNQNHEINTVYEDPGVTIPEDYTVIINGEVDITSLGQNSLEYTILDTDGVTVKTLTRSVTVVDTIAPTFDVTKHNLEVNEYSDIDWTLYVENITDNSNFDISLDVIVDNVVYHEIGSYEVTVEATDISDNATTKSFQVIVEDTTPPEVEFNETLLFAFGSSDPDYIIVDVNDNYYAFDDLTISSDINDIIQDEITGLHTITYIIEDPSGNVTEQSLDIQFVEDIYHFFEYLFLNDNEQITSGYKNNFPSGMYYYWLNFNDGNSVSITEENYITFRYTINTQYGSGKISLSADYGSFREATAGIHIGSGIDNYTTAFVYNYNILVDNPSTDNTFQSYSLNYLDIPQDKAEEIFNSNLVDAINAFKDLMIDLGIDLK